MTIAERVRCILDARRAFVEFARGGAAAKGGKSSKGKGKDKGKKGKGVATASKGGACCKGEGGKFAPGNNYGKLNAKGTSQRAAANRVKARLAAKSQVAKAGAAAKAASGPAKGGIAGAVARSKAASAKAGQVQAQKAAAALEKRQARNTKARERRVAEKTAAKATREGRLEKLKAAVAGKRAEAKGRAAGVGTKPDKAQQEVDRSSALRRRGFFTKPVQTPRTPEKPTKAAGRGMSEREVKADQLRRRGFFVKPTQTAERSTKASGRGTPERAAKAAALKESRFNAQREAAKVKVSTKAEKAAQARMEKMANRNALHRSKLISQARRTEAAKGQAKVANAPAKAAGRGTPERAAKAAALRESRFNARRVPRSAPVVEGPVARYSGREEVVLSRGQAKLTVRQLEKGSDRYEVKNEYRVYGSHLNDTQKVGIFKGLDAAKAAARSHLSRVEAVDPGGKHLGVKVTSKATGRGTPERAARAAALRGERSRATQVRADAAKRMEARKTTKAKGDPVARANRLAEKSFNRMRDLERRVWKTPNTKEGARESKALLKRVKVAQDRGIALRRREDKLRQVAIDRGVDTRRLRILSKAKGDLAVAKGDLSGKYRKQYMRDASGKLTAKQSQERHRLAGELKRSRKAIQKVDPNKQARIAEQRARAERRRAQQPRLPFEQASALKRLTGKSKEAATKAAGVLKAKPTAENLPAKLRAAKKAQKRSAAKAVANRPAPPSTPVTVPKKEVSRKQVSKPLYGTAAGQRFEARAASVRTRPETLAKSLPGGQATPVRATTKASGRGTPERAARAVELRESRYLVERVPKSTPITEGKVATYGGRKTVELRRGAAKVTVEQVAKGSNIYEVKNKYFSGGMGGTKTQSAGTYDGMRAAKAAARENLQRVGRVEAGGKLGLARGTRKERAAKKAKQEAAAVPARAAVLKRIRAKSRAAAAFKSALDSARQRSD